MQPNSSDPPRCPATCHSELRSHVFGTRIPYLHHIAEIVFVPAESDPRSYISYAGLHYAAKLENLLLNRQYRYRVRCCQLYNEHPTKAASRVEVQAPVVQSAGIVLEKNGEDAWVTFSTRWDSSSSTMETKNFRVSIFGDHGFLGSKQRGSHKLVAAYETKRRALAARAGVANQTAHWDEETCHPFFCVWSGIPSRNFLVEEASKTDLVWAVGDIGYQVGPAVGLGDVRYMYQVVGIYFQQGR